jgi:hypothetical protein
MRRRTALAAAALAALTLGPVLAGCGGGSEDASPTTTDPAGDLGDEVGSTTTADGDPGVGATGLPDDPCALLGDAEVASLLGTAVPGNEGVSSLIEEAPQFVSCSWGSFLDDVGVVSVAVSTPSGEAGIDYLEMLAGGAGGQGTPVAVGGDGELLDVFIMPGGGGDGSSVLFRQDGLTVVVSRSGEAVDTVALESAAAQVSSRL